MDVLHLVDSQQQFKGKDLQGLILQNWVKGEDRLLGVRLVEKKLLLEEEVDQVRKGQQSRPSCDQDDSARLGLSQLKSLAFLLAQLDPLDGLRGNALCELSLLVGSEHQGNCV